MQGNGWDLPSLAGRVLSPSPGYWFLVQWLHLPEFSTGSPNVFSKKYVGPPLLVAGMHTRCSYSNHPVFRILSALILSREFFLQLYAMRDYSRGVLIRFFSAISPRNAIISG